MDKLKKGEELLCDMELNVRRIEEQNKSLEKLVEEKKQEAEALSSMILNLKWKQKRIEFASYYQEKEREEERKKIKLVREEINAADKWCGVDSQFEEMRSKMKALTKENGEIDQELRKLRETDQKNEEAILQYSQTVQVLKNRNAAMMLKLKKQKQEFEEKVENYSIQLRDKHF